MRTRTTTRTQEESLSTGRRGTAPGMHRVDPVLVLVQTHHGLPRRGPIPCQKRFAAVFWGFHLELQQTALLTAPSVLFDGLPAHLRAVHVVARLRFLVSSFQICG